MTKYLTCAFLSAALVLSGTCNAEPKQVGQASDEGVKTARRNKILAYSLAAGAVAIAVATLVLVAKNHHPHHHHHHHNAH